MTENPHAEAREGHICATCGRQAAGLGYTAHHRFNPVWVCTDETCIDQARTVYGMAQHTYNIIEGRACSIDARNAALDYLQSIDKTDLAAMTEEEITILFRAIVTGYRTGIKRRLLNEEAPF